MSVQEPFGVLLQCLWFHHEAAGGVPPHAASALTDVPWLVQPRRNRPQISSTSSVAPSFLFLSRSPHVENDQLLEGCEITGG